MAQRPTENPESGTDAAELTASEPDPRPTPLHAQHVELGAKLVPFAGFHLPIQYPAGIQREHHAVRTRAGIFDVSHMGEVEITGPQALDLVQLLTVNDAGKLAVGRAQYSVMCREDGGALDDLLVYRIGEEAYLLVVNAANRDRDVEWMRSHAARFDARVDDRSDAIALIALQGPAAAGILAGATDVDVDELKSFSFTRGDVAGVEALVSRTGYTGEDGFELYVSGADAPTVWRTLLEKGGEELIPVGLGARDTLRLEAGLILYGNDLDEDHTPLEAGLSWVVKLDKGPFLGRDALERQKEQGVPRKLVGIRLTERGFPRPGYPVAADDETVGHVTSGTMSPTLGTGIALAYLPTGLADPGTSVAVRIRNRDVAGRVERPPFRLEEARPK